MPNWVQNEIIFENIGDEKVAALVRELKLSTENGEQAFDFNKLIPMPESLNIESGSNTDRAIAYYITERLTIPVEQTNLSGLISNCFSNDWANEVVSRLKNETETSPEVWDKLYENGKQYMYNREHYGCYTWFDWCRRNWGTKWNACNAEWSLDDGMLVFQTAWSAPFPIIEALAEKYPDLDFTHRWADEDIGNNCGQMWYSEGYGSELDVEDSRALAMDIWGYTEDDFEEDEWEDDADDETEEDMPVCTEEPDVEDNGLSWEDVIGITSG